MKPGIESKHTTTAPSLGEFACGASRVRSTVSFVDQIADLAAIFEPELNVVALRRVPTPEVARDALSALAELDISRQLTLNPGSVSEEFSQDLKSFPHFCRDILFWIDVFAELTGAQKVGLRLERLQKAMCPRFHVDHVTLRLVTTYCGGGTEFVSSECVDRRLLGHAAGARPDEESGLLLSSDGIRGCNEFDVVLLKGDAWPNNDGAGAVHRSPAASSKEPRLVLTLDHL